MEIYVRLTTFGLETLLLHALSVHAALVGFAFTSVSARFLQLPDYEVTSVASLEQLQNG